MIAAALRSTYWTHASGETHCVCVCVSVCGTIHISVCLWSTLRGSCCRSMLGPGPAEPLPYELNVSVVHAGSEGFACVSAGSGVHRKTDRVRHNRRVFSCIYCWFRRIASVNASVGPKVGWLPCPLVNWSRACFWHTRGVTETDH